MKNVLIVGIFILWPSEISCSVELSMNKVLQPWGLVPQSWIRAPPHPPPWKRLFLCLWWCYFMRKLRYKWLFSGVLCFMIVAFPEYLYLYSWTNNSREKREKEREKKRNIMFIKWSTTDACAELTDGHLKRMHLGGRGSTSISKCSYLC